MSSLDPDVERLHDEAPFTDTHAHPSLKAFIFNRNLWNHHGSGHKLNPWSSRTDFQMLTAGRVGVVWAAHYVVEQEVFEQCGLLDVAASVFLPAYWKVRRGRPFIRLMQMIAKMEAEIDRKPDRIALATSPDDIEAIRAAGKIAVVHTVEGAHVLEGKKNQIASLAGAGVAALTLSHFFWNDVARQADGIPSDQLLKQQCTFDFGADGKPALTDFGREVIEMMHTFKILVDVTHCDVGARKEIYEQVDGRSPVLATHVGVTGNDKNADKDFRDDPYNLTDEDLLAIKATGGAIGVIFYPYWLTSRPQEQRKNGLERIWNTMDHIKTITGCWDHVMIGTDFDGLTDPPDDVHDASYFPAVTRMLLDRGVSEDDIKKILGGNAMRVLREGWRGI